MNDMHEANRRSWDAVSPKWQAKIDTEKPWRQVPVNPALVLEKEELRHLGDVAGKNVCVLGSGDNLIVFALAGMGADVTSVDVSQTQLDIAAGRARELGLAVTFLRADVTDLSALPTDRFDLVYTGGHVAVWISDLKTYYREAVRILQPEGLFMVTEYHPFRRIWEERPDCLQVEMAYFEQGPFQYDRSEDVPGAKPGSYPSYEFHWTVSDYAMAVIEAGCDLLALEEFGTSVEWEVTPLAGLPHLLMIVGRKSD
jgi:SAM-dependent methyltransferase|tara:strand:+ start:1839 stop:2603 length:765 start_codon:yes stop_codon:yes gene_type:complete